MTISIIARYAVFDKSTNNAKIPAVGVRRVKPCAAHAGEHEFDYLCPIYLYASAQKMLMELDKHSSAYIIFSAGKMPP